MHRGPDCLNTYTPVGICQRNCVFWLSCRLARVVRLAESASGLLKFIKGLKKVAAKF